MKYLCLNCTACGVSHLKESFEQQGIVAMNINLGFCINVLLFLVIKVTSCAWVPDSCQLFTGSKCGVITAYMNRFTSSTVSKFYISYRYTYVSGLEEEMLLISICQPWSLYLSSYLY